MPKPSFQSEPTLASNFARAQLAELISHLPVCLGLYDLEGRCVLASEALARWLQRPLSEIPGRHVEQLWPDGFGAVLLARHEPARAGGSVQSVEELPCGPVRRAVCVRRFAWRAANGEVEGVIEFFEGPVVPGPAEAVGRLALGLAQDFHGALGLLVGHLDLLEKAVAENSRAHRLLSELRLVAGYAAELPQQLVRFVQGGLGNRHPINLNTLLSSLERLLRPRLGEMASLRLELAAGGAWVEGDPVQLTQVLLDLSRLALPPGGRLLLRCEQLPGGEGSEPVEQDPHVRITIRRARGVGPWEREHGRQPDSPFPLSEGALALLQELVRGHRGVVRVSATPGQGTSFQILLPVRPSRETSALESASSDSAVVLVLEREPDVRQLAGKILKHGRFTPILCQDFREAGQLSKGLLQPVRLIVADAELCSGQGAQHLGALLASQRPAGVLYTTAGEGLPRTLPGPVLLKPFRAEQLLRAVEAALAE